MDGPMMGRRLSDDPAWLRYEWELQHLPFMVLRQELTEIGRTLRDAFAPVIEQLVSDVARLA